MTYVTIAVIAVVSFVGGGVVNHLYEKRVIAQLQNMESRLKAYIINKF